VKKGECMKIWSLIFSAVLFLPSCFANLHPQPCGFGLQAEFLYWRPNVEGFGFTQFTTPPNDSFTPINTPHFRPGFRLEGVYAFSCLNDIHARFTYFNSGSNVREVSGNFGPTTLATVRDDLRFKYYAVEVLLGRWLYNCSDFDLELQYGINYSNLRLRETFLITTTGVVDTRQFSRIWGVGPELALSFRYPFPVCFLGQFGIMGDVRGMLLSSKFQRFVISTGSITTIQTADPLWNITPAADLKLGLSWDYPCGCFKPHLEAGYEWMYYQKAFIGFANASFQGPYVALGVTF
jgi:hypothetical protein